MTIELGFLVFTFHYIVPSVNLSPYLYTQVLDGLDISQHVAWEWLVGSHQQSFPSTSLTRVLPKMCNLVTWGTLLLHFDFIEVFNV